MKKAIAIKESNKQKISDYIKEVEGRSTVRTITYDDIIQAIDELEEKLGICKKDMLDIECVIDINAQTFPAAYRYTPESTQFMLKRHKSGWFLYWVMRDTVKRPNRKFSCRLPMQAKRAIIESKTYFGEGSI